MRVCDRGWGLGVREEMDVVGRVDGMCAGPFPKGKE